MAYHRRHCDLEGRLIRERRVRKEEEEEGYKGGAAAAVVAVVEVEGMAAAIDASAVPAAVAGVVAGEAPPAAAAEEEECHHDRLFCCFRPSFSLAAAALDAFLFATTAAALGRRREPPAASVSGVVASTAAGTEEAVPATAEATRPLRDSSLGEGDIMAGRGGESGAEEGEEEEAAVASLPSSALTSLPKPPPKSPPPSAVDLLLEARMEERRRRASSPPSSVCGCVEVVKLGAFFLGFQPFCPLLLRGSVGDGDRADKKTHPRFSPARARSFRLANRVRPKRTNLACRSSMSAGEALPASRRREAAVPLHCYFVDEEQEPLRELPRLCSSPSLSLSRPERSRPSFAPLDQGGTRLISRTSSITRRALAPRSSTLVKEYGQKRSVKKKKGKPRARLSAGKKGKPRAGSDVREKEVSSGIFSLSSSFEESSRKRSMRAIDAASHALPCHPTGFLQGHEGAVLCVAFSASGAYALTGGMVSLI